MLSDAVRTTALLNTSWNHNADSLGWDARREEVIRIKLKKRLVATAVMGMVLLMGVVLVASLNGDDKPVITTNPPPADEEPQDAQVDPAPDAETLPPASDDYQDEDQDDPCDPELPEDDEDGAVDDDEDDASEDDGGKAHGLQIAIQAHIKNMEKAEMKGKSVPPGLQNSLQLLTEMYAGLLVGEKDSGNANGHNKSA